MGGVEHVFDACMHHDDDDWSQPRRRSSMKESPRETLVPTRLRLVLARSVPCCSWFLGLGFIEKGAASCCYEGSGKVVMERSKMRRGMYEDGRFCEKKKIEKKRKKEGHGVRR